MTHSIQEISAKISVLPDSIQQEVIDFIEFMQIKVDRQSAADKNLSTEDEFSTVSRKAGALAGRIKISDDFNAPLADFSDYEQ
jgi:hypothetical protein